MESLPPEILQHISLYMGRKDLLSLMLTSRNLVDCARHSLYADLRVNLLSPPILLYSLSEERQCTFSGRLQPCHPAQLVRHFTVSAAALAHPAHLTLLCRSLLQMNNLVSLDVSIKTYPDSMAREVFTEELCSSSAFLPNLLALKTDDVYVAMAIIPGRPVYSVCVNDSVPEALRCQFIQSLASSKSPISQLQIRFDVADNESTAATFHTIAAKFSQVTALCVEFHIVNPSERPLKWTTLKVSVRCPIPTLRSFDLVGHYSSHETCSLFFVHVAHNGHDHIPGAVPHGQRGRGGRRGSRAFPSAR